MVKIRSTQSNDREAVVAVVRAAFSSDGHDPQEEVDIVTETWARGAAPEGLDLVAVEDAIVVGYVVAARGRLSDTDVLGVAPLAVTPGRQRAGIGTALMTEFVTHSERSCYGALRSPNRSSMLRASAAIMMAFAVASSAPVAVDVSIAFTKILRPSRLSNVTRPTSLSPTGTGA
jgi:GNAT superfamily N-acetyltransferase